MLNEKPYLGFVKDKNLTIFFKKLTSGQPSAETNVVGHRLEPLMAIPDHLFFAMVSVCG